MHSKLSSHVVVTLAFLGCSNAPDAPTEAPAETGGGHAGMAGTPGGSAGSAGTAAALGGAAGSGGAAPGGSGAGGSTSEAGSGGTSTVVTPGTCEEAPSAAPPSTWVNATGNLAGMASACANLALVAAKPCSRTIIAGVVQKGLWATTDSGTTWTGLGAGPGSDTVTNTTTSITFDPESPDAFWETGLHVGPGLFSTTDGGTAFQSLGTMNSSQLVSVDFSDPERQTLLVGTHGQRQQLFLSKDGGANFENVGLNLAATVNSSESPLVIDASTYLLGACGHIQGYDCGILRSTDSGQSWTSMSELKVSHYGAPLWASDGSIYWPLLDDAGIAKSTDLGLTWDHVLDSAVGVTPLELPDGSIVTVGMGTLVRSKDGGQSFAPIGEPLPFSIAGYQNTGSLAYSTLEKTFYYSHYDCGNVVLDDAVMKAGFDWEAE